MDHVFDTSPLRLLWQSISLRDVDDIAIEEFLLQQPVVAPEQAALRDSELNSFRAFCVLRLILSALMCWSAQARDAGGHTKVEHTATSISMALDQAKDLLDKVNDLNLQLDALESILSLLFVGRTGDTTAMYSATAEVCNGYIFAATSLISFGRFTGSFP
jgi:hypothetical protein